MSTILIDITPAVRTSPSGIAYYIIELVRALLARGDHQYTLGVRPGKMLERKLLQSLQFHNATFRPLIPPFFQLFAGRFDLFHSPGSLRVLGPEGSRLRVPRGIPRRLLTLHDLIPMEGWFVPGTDAWIARRTRLLRETLARTDGVLTDSEFVRKRVLDVFGYPPDRIKTVWLGLNHDRFRVHDPERVRATLHKLKIDRPYFISFSAMYPRKNTAGLVRAFARSRASHDGLLMLGGKTKGDVYENCVTEIKRHSMEDKIKFLGYVDHDDVPLLYCGARGSLFPSLYEGFGFPVIEGMACGVPVATSNVSSMPEIGGDAAEYFNPENDESIAAAMDNIWENESIRTRRIQAGIERAKSFSWEKTTKETLDFYQTILNSPAREPG